MNIEYNLEDLLVFLQKYKNKDVVSLKEKLNIHSNAKSINYILATNMCNSYKGKALFDNFSLYNNVHVKTIQLSESGKSKEAMSFAPINYEKIIFENWETSTFKKYMDGIFILFVFKKEFDENLLIDVFSWEMNDNDKCKVKFVWENTKNLIKGGNAFKKLENGKFYTNFLSEADTEICHIRPHGKDSTDFRKIPVQDSNSGNYILPKYSFWFNHSYLNKIVKERENKNE